MMKNSNKIFFIISFIVLFISFQFNFFKVAYEDDFESFQYDSEALVIGRLAHSKINGLFSDNGQLGFVSVDNLEYGNKGFFEGGKKVYLNASIPFEYKKYNSQFGLQGVFFSLLDKMLDFFHIPITYHLKTFHLFTSAFLALILSSMLCIFYIEFGLLPALITLGGITCSHWLVYFGKNLYWVAGSWFVPLLVVLLIHCMEKIHNVFSWKLASSMIFISVLLKSLCGYEYISTILLSMIVPIVYYALIMDWTWKKYIHRTLLIGLAGLFGFIAAFFIHMWQLFLGTQDILKAFDLIYERITIRTFADPNTLDINSAYMASAKADITTVLLKYLGGMALRGGFAFYTLILAVAITSIIGFYFIKRFTLSEIEKKQFTALLITTWISITAPISWYVLAKSHSFVHGHMNYVLWYIPYLIFGFLLMGYVVNMFFNKLALSMNK